MSTGAMYKALLHVQWKHQRTELTFLTMAGAIVAPASLWQALTTQAEAGPVHLLQTSSQIGTFGSLIALAAGMLLAVRPFVLDGHAGHTYALALPVPRSTYALLRAATGLTLSLLPALGFLTGGLVAAQAFPPALLLRAYPVGLAVRFVLAAALAFALGFGVQYGIGRRTARWIVIVALTIGGFELFGQLALHGSLTAPFWQLLFSGVSPLRVFSTRWMLFDV